jgi:hypothetical protein
MLDRGRNEVRRSTAGSKVAALQGEVIRLATTTREHHVGGRTSQQFRDLCAASLDELLRPDSRPVRTRGVSVSFALGGAHRLHHGRMERRTRVEIQVDSPHSAITSSHEMVRIGVRLACNGFGVGLPADLER